MSNTKTTDAATEPRKKRAYTRKAAPAKKTTTKKRIAKKARPPFRVLLGRVNKAGSGYVFDKPAKEFKAADEAMAFAQGAIDKDDESLREILIVINPSVDTAKEAK